MPTTCCHTDRHNDPPQFTAPNARVASADASNQSVEPTALTAIPDTPEKIDEPVFAADVTISKAGLTMLLCVKSMPTAATAGIVDAAKNILGYFTALANCTRCGGSPCIPVSVLSSALGMPVTSLGVEEEERRRDMNSDGGEPDDWEMPVTMRYGVEREGTDMTSRVRSEVPEGRAMYLLVFHAECTIAAVAFSTRSAACSVGVV